LIGIWISGTRVRQQHEDACGTWPAAVVVTSISTQDGVRKEELETRKTGGLVLGSVCMSFSIPGSDMAIFLNKLLTL